MIYKYTACLLSCLFSLQTHNILHINVKGRIVGCLNFVRYDLKLSVQRLKGAQKSST